MSNRTRKPLNLLKQFQKKGESNLNFLPKIYIGEDESGIILLTAECHLVKLHYIAGDLKKYILCNRGRKQKCVACQCGRKAIKKYLLPIFSIEKDSLAWLEISDDFRPGALLPQLLAVLDANPISVVLLSKHNNVHKVRTGVLPKGYKPSIKKVQKQLEKIHLEPSDFYLKMSNDDLSEIPELDRLLKIKGLKGEQLDEEDVDEE